MRYGLVRLGPAEPHEISASSANAEDFAAVDRRVEEAWSSEERMEMMAEDAAAAWNRLGEREAFVVVDLTTRALDDGSSAGAVAVHERRKAVASVRRPSPKERVCRR